MVASRSEGESQTLIPPLFSHPVVKRRLVLTLVTLTVITFSARAQGSVDVNDSKRRPVAPATIFLSSSGNPSQDEYADLKFSSSVRELADLARLSPEAIFHLCWVFNFFLLLALILWKAIPLLKAIFQERSKFIRQAIDDAQRLSEDAAQRLAEVEKRWAQLDSAIATIQAGAEAAMENEEKALATQTSQEIHRILEYARFEIDKAVERARHELTLSVADVAVLLAHQSIRIDQRTDQALVKGFTGVLAHQEFAPMTVQPSARVTAGV